MPIRRSGLAYSQYGHPTALATSLTVKLAVLGFGVEAEFYAGEVPVLGEREGVAGAGEHGDGVGSAEVKEWGDIDLDLISKEMMVAARNIDLIDDGANG